MEQWRNFNRGDIVKFHASSRLVDPQIIADKGERCAAFIEYTKPHGYARVAFYGDRKELTYLVHPEALLLVHHPRTF